MLLFAWGLFKKVVVADQLAFYADRIYNNVHDYSGLTLIIGTYAYALQVYFDFAGYTDMARGAGRIFGIELTENFNRPYGATSIADFWRRWHISFSRWILDYIFKPLQMTWRHRGQAGTAAAVLVTFLVSGIWHGGAWGFVIWGLLHGTYLAASVYYRPYQKRLHKWLGVEKSRWLKWWQIFVTFNLVSFAWIFFRANSLGDAFYVISNINYGYKGLRSGILLSQGLVSLIITVCVVWLSYFMKNIFVNYGKKPHLVIRWLAYHFVFLLVLFFYVTTKSPDFLYFRF